MNHEELRKEIVSSVRRVVVKLGSSVVTNAEGLDYQIIQGFVDDLSRFMEKGKEFIIVSSGAIAAGTKRLALKGGVKTIPQKQAAAAVGQSRLMTTYEDAFAMHGIKVGQMLLTKDDLTHRRRYLNARNTLVTLLGWGAVPIINENDTVMVEEIQLGDNDNLSALVAALADADLLVALTDMDGLMDCDPRANPDACLIPLVDEVTPDIKKLASSVTSAVGRGGMGSKLDAAAKAGMAGVPMIIARGKVPHIIPRLLNGEVLGTLILPAKEQISARKHWIRFNLDPEGTLIVDQGAACAVSQYGKSLLPVGVIGVDGTFEHGAVVAIEDADGNRLAVGLVNYSSAEIEKIKGLHTAEIDWYLGYRRNDEAVHVDNLVLVNAESSS